MCKIYSNICITQTQVDDFFKQLNLQVSSYSDIEKVLEKSSISLPGYPYGAFSLKSFTNYFQNSIAFQTLLYQLRIIMSDRALSPRIYRNIVQRMKYEYYTAEEKFMFCNRYSKVPKPNSSCNNNNNNNTPSTPNVSPPDTPTTNTPDNNNNYVIRNSSSLPPTLNVSSSPSLNIPPTITVIQVNNSNMNFNQNKSVNGTTATVINNNNTLEKKSSIMTAEVQFPHSSPSSFCNSEFNDNNSNASNNSKTKKDILPPTESFCQKLSRVMFTIEPPPYHSDFKLEKDTLINGLDNMIYILRKQYGYSTRYNSVRDVIASGRQKSLNFSRNMILSRNYGTGSSSLPSSPHSGAVILSPNNRNKSVRHASLGCQNVKILPLKEIAEF